MIRRRAWWPALSRPVWLLQAGNVVNTFGLGMVLPFEIIYLHDVRGFATQTAGLVLSTVMGTAAVTAPPTGTIVDRVGARPVLVAGSLLSAAGYGAMAFVHHPAQAFACSVVSGLGTGASMTAGPTLMAALAEGPARASAFSLGRVAVNLGIALGSVTGGFIARTSDPGSFRVLYLVDAATFVGYLLVVVLLIPAVRAPGRKAGSAGGGFGTVVRDRPFVALMGANVVFLVVGFTLFANIMPAYAKGQTPVDERGIGFVFLVNTVFITVVALPIGHAVVRRRRAASLAVTGGIWAVATLMMIPAAHLSSALLATWVLALAGVVQGVGECIHAAVIGPTVADLAPPGLDGRYMSALGLTTSVGFAVGPAVGSALLAASPTGLWLAAAAAVALTGVLVLRLESVLPQHASAPAAPAP